MRLGNLKIGIRVGLGLGLVLIASALISVVAINNSNACQETKK